MAVRVVVVVVVQLAVAVLASNTLPAVKTGSCGRFFMPGALTPCGRFPASAFGYARPTASSAGFTLWELAIAGE